MNLLFFDSESTGFSKNARMISLAWILTDRFGTSLVETHHLVKPNGWEMPTEKFWAENGFSHEKNLQEGVSIDFILEDFSNAMDMAGVLISHNIPFDLRMLNYELDISGRLLPNNMQTFCTMEGSKHYCKISQPGKTGFKKPTLSELYLHLFEKNVDGHHNALMDVTACKNSFFELLRRGVITLPGLEAINMDGD